MKGPKRQPDSLRYIGWRPTAIRPHFKQLVERLAQECECPRSEIIETALMQFAISIFEEAEKGIKQTDED
jgi:hypothetical protein